MLVGIASIKSLWSHFVVTHGLDLVMSFHLFVRAVVCIVQVEGFLSLL
jgi:hypothetical protein